MAKKVKIGQMKHKTLVQGDVNLLNKNEVLITESEGYTILREKTNEGNIKTYVVIPLEEFVKVNNKSKNKKKYD